jgi:hypothetical protein
LERGSRVISNSRHTKERCEGVFERVALFMILGRNVCGASCCRVSIAAATSSVSIPATWEENEQVGPQNGAQNAANVRLERMRSGFQSRFAQWRQCCHCASPMTKDGCLLFIHRKILPKSIPSKSASLLTLQPPGTCNRLHARQKYAARSDQQIFDTLRFANREEATETYQGARPVELA